MNPELAVEIYNHLLENKIWFCFWEGAFIDRKYCIQIIMEGD